MNVHSFLKDQGLPLVERVDVDGERWYRLPGETDPANYFASVTNVLSVANAKPLVDYFKTTSSRKQTATLEQTANLGTKIHDLVERDLQGETIPEAELTFGEQDTIGLRDWFKRWQKLKQEKQITATALEVPVVNIKYGYAGTLDILGTYMGQPAIFDVKSGFYGVKAGYQLAAYKQAFFDMIKAGPTTPEGVLGEKAQGLRLVGLSLPWNKIANCFVYEHEDFCWNRFLDALGLFRGLNYHRLDKMKWRYLHVERNEGLHE